MATAILTSFNLFEPINDKAKLFWQYKQIESAYDRIIVKSTNKQEREQLIQFAKANGFNKLEHNDGTSITYGNYECLKEADFNYDNCVNLSRLHSVHYADGWYIKRFADMPSMHRELSYFKSYYALPHPEIVAFNEQTLQIKEAQGICLANKPELYTDFLSYVKAFHKSFSPYAYSGCKLNLYHNEVLEKYTKRQISLCWFLDDKLVIEGKRLIDLAFETLDMSSAPQMIIGHFDLHSSNVYHGLSYQVIDPRGHYDGSPWGPIEYETSKIAFGMLIIRSLELAKDLNEPILPLLPIDDVLDPLNDKELAWLMVHLLTNFGVYTSNPLKAQLSLKLGVQYARYIADNAL